MKRTCKKVLSAALTFALAAMNMTLPVKASVNYADWEVKEMNKNLIPDSTENGGFMYFGTRLGKAEYSDFYTTNQGVGSAFKYSYTGTGSLVLKMNWGGFEGFFLNRNRGDGKGSFGFVPEAGKSYVFKANVKNASPEGVTPSFGIGMNGTWDPAKIITTKEYGLAGMPLTNEWQEFKGTLVLPDSFKDDTTYGATPLVGFAAGAPEGSAFWMDASEKDSVYFAEEQVYKFNNTIDKNSVIRNDKITANAEILNQLGIKGNLSQDVTWLVVNEDRQTVNDNFKIEETENSAAVTPLKSAAAGKYILIAHSKEYDINMGAEFEVKDGISFEDTILPEINANLIPDSTENGGFMYFGTRLGKAEYSDFYTTNQGVGSAFKYSYTGTGSLVPTMNWGGFEGFFLNRNRADGKGSFRFVPEAGKSYVFKANVKNASPEGVTPSFGIGMNGTWDPAKIITTKEYGLAGMPLTNEWQEFKGTLVLPDSFKDDTTYGATPLVGFAAGSPESSAFWMDASEKDSVYFAEEQAYQMKLTTDCVSELNEGTVIDVKAEIVNQLGVQGSLNQDVDWYVVNPERTDVLSGAAVNKYDGGAKITITDSSLDDIRIVAVSNEYYIVSGINPVKKSIRTLYVSKTGDDSAIGTIDMPLKTLTGARNAVRKIKDSGYQGEFEVVFGGGKYYFDSTVIFNEEDSDVTYKAANGEDVIFTGAIEINLSDAVKVTDETVLSKLKDEVKDNVVAIDLTKQGYSSMAAESIAATVNEICRNCEYPELYLDGNEQTLAQWPNGEAQYVKWGYVDNDTFSYTEDEPSKWTDTKDSWIGGYIDYDYIYSRVPILSVDANNKQITLSTSKDVQLDNSKTDKTYRWKAFNLLEEIDMPTEWYIDRDTMTLYYYMPKTNENSVLEISSLKNEMIKINSASKIGFDGIKFEKTRGNVITTTNVEGISVENCTFENIGVNALAFNGTTNAQTDKNFWQIQKIDASYNCKVADNKFNNIGGSAIYMEGGNVDTLTPSGNVIQNNIIYKAAQKIKDRNAIEIRGCGILIQHNNISRTADQAIRHYGNDHLIQYNEIHDVIQDTDDSGAVYGGRNTIQRGTEISYNYIHDIMGTFETVFGHKPAIYWDDYQTGITAHHNIINNAKINVYTNGIDNNYSYNTSIGIADKNIYFKNGGASPNEEPASGTVFASSIMNQELYFNKYPSLNTILGTYGSDLKNKKLAGLNVIKGNLSVNSAEGDNIGTYTNYPNSTEFGDVMISKGEKNANVIDNVNNGSASFVNASKQDYRIKGTEDCSTGLLNESFDIELIGIQTDNTIDTSKVKIAAPYNNEVIDNDNVKFVWYDSLGATNYTITVATDENFNNVAAVKNTDYNYAEIELPGTDTAYYWKVTAHNTSREFASDWQSDVYTFTKGGKISVNAILNDSDSISLKATNNYYTDGINASIYITEYDNSGKLISVQLINKVLTYKVTERFADETITVKNPDEAASVKIFVWNNNTPLANAVILK